VAPDASWLGPLEKYLNPVAALAQPPVEALLRAPDEAGWALISLGILLMALGRHGQRLLIAVLTGAAAWWGAEHLWAGTKVSWTDRALLGALLGCALGALLSRWLRSLLCGAGGAALGHWLAERTGFPPWPVAGVMAAIAFFLSYGIDRTLAVLLPPLAAAPALVAGAVRVAPKLQSLQAAHGGASALLIASLLLAMLLIPLALEREARAQRRRASKLQGSDDLKKAATRAAQKAVFEKAAGKKAR
jgi:hypothetical protein